jgi:hypothetical protein
MVFWMQRGKAAVRTITHTCCKSRSRGRGNREKAGKGLCAGGKNGQAFSFAFCGQLVKRARHRILSTETVEKVFKMLKTQVKKWKTRRRAASKVQAGCKMPAFF